MSPSSLQAAMEEYDALLQELSENITNEDLDQLKSACKEDIPTEKSEEITSCQDWFNYLEKHDKLAKGKAWTLGHDLQINNCPDKCDQGTIYGWRCSGNHQQAAAKMYDFYENLG